MESISHLLGGETILWKTSHKEKISERLRYTVIIFGMIIPFNLLFIYIARVFLLLWIIPIEIDLIFIGILLYSLFHALKTKKIGQLTWKDMNKYEMLCILTNKRWILKDLASISLKKSGFMEEGITYYKDFILINLELIKNIEISVVKEFRKKKYYTRLYLNYNKSKPKKKILGTSFYTEKKFKLLLDNIKGVMEVKREEEFHQKYSSVSRFNYYF